MFTIKKDAVKFLNLCYNLSYYYGSKPNYFLIIKPKSNHLRFIAHTKDYHIVYNDYDLSSRNEEHDVCYKVEYRPIKLGRDKMCFYCKFDNEKLILKKQYVDECYSFDISPDKVFMENIEKQIRCMYDRDKFDGRISIHVAILDVVMKYCDNFDKISFFGKGKNCLITVNDIEVLMLNQ